MVISSTLPSCCIVWMLNGEQEQERLNEVQRWRPVYGYQPLVFQLLIPPGSRRHPPKSSLFLTSCGKTGGKTRIKEGTRAEWEGGVYIHETDDVGWKIFQRTMQHKNQVFYTSPPSCECSLRSRVIWNCKSRVLQSGIEEASHTLG